MTDRQTDRQPEREREKDKERQARNKDRWSVRGERKEIRIEMETREG